MWNGTRIGSRSILALFLTEGILDYLELVSYEKSSSGKTIYESELVLSLEERNIIPAEYKQYQYKSCGFMEPRYIQDYPIRNMLVKLKIRRRRWEIIIEGEKKKVSRDWEVIAQGTRMSEGYAAFLKEISRF